MSISYCRFVDALVFGDYPDIVKKRAGTRIPYFTEDEAKQVKGSFDFIGINHYSSMYIKNDPMKQNMDNRNFAADAAVDMIGTLLGSLTKLGTNSIQAFPHNIPWT